MALALVVAMALDMAAFLWMTRIKDLPEIMERLSGVHLECNDAIKVIKSWDSPHTFFYCDPPYVGANQGHYKGYTEEDFKNLCEALNSIQGSFLLSSYANKHTLPHVSSQWERFDFKAKMSAARDKSLNTDRVETVWRHISKIPVRSEIQALYNSGAYDCFTGKKEPDNLEFFE